MRGQVEFCRLLGGREVVGIPLRLLWSPLRCRLGGHRVEVRVNGAAVLFDVSAERGAEEPTPETRPKWFRLVAESRHFEFQ